MNTNARPFMLIVSAATVPHIERRATSSTAVRETAG
jgi:hypothetical protein